MLEEDYKVIQPLIRRKDVSDDAASNLARFLANDHSWQFIRLGYNPRLCGAKNVVECKHCKAECTCETVSNGICQMEAGRTTSESCWVGSTVGYATHRRAWAKLRYLGDYYAKAGAKKASLPIDKWMTGKTNKCRNESPVNYLIPGILHQRVTFNSRREIHVPAMANFASKCVKPRRLGEIRTTTIRPQSLIIVAESLVADAQQSTTSTNLSAIPVTCPRHIDIASTGKSGSKMLIYALNEAIGIQVVKESPMHAPPGRMMTLDFHNEKSDYNVFVHLVRNPIDVALSLASQKKKWLLKHLKNFGFNQADFKAKSTVLQNQGPRMLLGSDLFELFDHMNQWQIAQLQATFPTRSVTLKYESLGEPNTIPCLKSMFCFKHNFKLPPRDATLGGSHNNNAANKKKSHFNLEGLSEKQRSELLKAYSKASNLYATTPSCAVFTQRRKQRP
jgi:hypothetical protein